MSIISNEKPEQAGMDLFIPTSGDHKYSEAYKVNTFQLWYRLGKPGSAVLRKSLEPDETVGNIPSKPLLDQWIRKFKEDALILDSQVAKELADHLVAEKVEMLNRHAKAGVKMQDMALTYLEANKEEMRIPIAVKMLVEGVRIERESRGVPQALEKMMNKSDEELLNDVQKLLNNAPVEFEQLESENYGEKENDQI